MVRHRRLPPLAVFFIGPFVLLLPTGLTTWIPVLDSKPFWVQFVACNAIYLLHLVITVKIRSQIILRCWLVLLLVIVILNIEGFLQARPWV